MGINRSSTDVDLRQQVDVSSTEAVGGLAVNSVAVVVVAPVQAGVVEVAGDIWRVALVAPGP